MLEKRDGTLLDWATYSSLDRITRQSQLSRFLHITALTTPIQLTPLEDHGPELSLLQEEAGVWAFALRYPDPSRLPTEGLALHLTKRHQTCPEFLIIGLVDGVYERLAMYNGIGYPDAIYDNYEAMEKTIQTIRLG